MTSPVEQALVGPIYLGAFWQDIGRFNEMYRMPEVETANTVEVLNRLKNFKKILEEECKELEDIQVKPGHHINEHMVPLADLLADIIVYCASEAVRWGIPLPAVLKIIMESNFSKLGADGNPIFDERGKLLKGPNYWKPEPKIQELLLQQIQADQTNTRKFIEG